MKHTTKSKSKSKKSIGQLWKVGTATFRIVRFEEEGHKVVAKHHDVFGTFFTDELIATTPLDREIYLMR
tara:strand:- start:784 stop:990 length:207 start_codon:yes stop_codon:yes gene_type:complete